MLMTTHESEATNERARPKRGGIRWPDVLNFTIAMLALLLGVASFYYQFIRETRGFTAQLLHGQTADGHGRLVLLVRNTGNRDEVLNEASLVFESDRGRDLVSRPLFQGDVVKPGEAKRIESGAFDVSKIVETFDYQWATCDFPPPPRRHPLTLKIVVVNERGHWIETRHPLGHVEVKPTGVGAGYSTASGQVLDLLHPAR